MDKNNLGHVFCFVSSKITEKYLQIKKNDAKLEDFKSQQKNLLILSLNL